LVAGRNALASGGCRVLRSAALLGLALALRQPEEVPKAAALSRRALRTAAQQVPVAVSRWVSAQRVAAAL
jgi:hypothetical protein